MFMFVTHLVMLTNALSIKIQFSFIYLYKFTEEQQEKEKLYFLTCNFLQGSGMIITVDMNINLFVSAVAHLMSMLLWPRQCLKMAAAKLVGKR